MLNLPVPEVEYENVLLEPSSHQEAMVAFLAERAEKVRNGEVSPEEDNMLNITNDGRKLALDQRLMNPLLPDDPNSKAANCVKRAVQIWKDTMEERSTQLIFCDLSTPKGDGSFNVYDDIRKKLMEKGVPQEEIAFVHDADSDQKKAALFSKVRSGAVRFLLGSTAKMGAGTNVQDRLIALHHLDVPWRPSDIEQQEGRILRQGNRNQKVMIFRYVTQKTFDAYSWQVIENKQKFISQIMTSKSPVRSCEDADETALTYAEVKALAAGDPNIKEKMELDIQVTRLKLLKANYTSQRYQLEDNITRYYPGKIAELEQKILALKQDIAMYNRNRPTSPDAFSMNVGTKVYTERKEAGTALIAMGQSIRQPNTFFPAGAYLGFPMEVIYESMNRTIGVRLMGSASHMTELGTDPVGNIHRINHVLERMEADLLTDTQMLEKTKDQMETARQEIHRPFEQEAELAEKMERLEKLNALLSVDGKKYVLEESKPEEQEPVKLPARTTMAEVKGVVAERKTAYKPIENKIRGMKAEMSFEAVQ
jgi:hypothetical protein